MKIISFILMACCLTILGCKKDKPSEMTVTDIDGNVYKTVKIGDQIWMTENLRVTHYNTGTTPQDEIAKVLEDADWKNLGFLNTPMYSYYDKDEANLAKYGALYNWHAVGTGKLAPKGWHVATEADFDKLMGYLGTNSGGKIKEAGTANWLFPNLGATNEVSFTARPAGYRVPDGSFVWLKEESFFWTYLQNSNTIAPVYNLSYDYEEITKLLGNNFGKNAGMSVRCVKD